MMDEDDPERARREKQAFDRFSGADPTPPTDEDVLTLRRMHASEALMAVAHGMAHVLRRLSEIEGKGAEEERDRPGMRCPE